MFFRLLTSIVALVAGVPAAGVGGVGDEPQVDGSISVTTLAVGDGLPANSVQDLCYDADGFLFVGTSGGLARYDGGHFRRYIAAETEGLAGDRILALHTDRQGRTWIGAHLGEPTVYEGGEFRAVPSTEPLHSVRQFIEDRSGNVWVLGSRIGLFKDGQLEVLGRGNEPGSWGVRLVEDGQGDIWVGSRTGSYRWSGGELVRVDDRPSNWLLTDFEGFVWSLLDGGKLERISGPAAAPIEFESGLIRDELVRGPDEKLLATSDGLVRMIAAQGDLGFRLEKVSVFGGFEVPKSLTSLLPAAGDDLWIGTGRFGLSYVQHRFVTVMEALGGRSSQPVVGVFPAGDGLALVKSADAERIRLVDRSGGVTPIRGSFGRALRLHSTLQVQGAVLVGTNRGVSRLEGDRLVALVEGGGGRSQLIEDREGIVWELRKGELRSLLDGDGVLPVEERRSVPSPDIFRIATYGGSIVGSARNELLRFNAGLLAWEPLVDLRRARARFLRAGPSGELWVSTYGDGLFRLSSDGTLDQWQRGDGLPDPFLGWISPVDDAGYLWLNSNSGIIGVNVEALDGIASGGSSGFDARLFGAPEGNGPEGASLGRGVYALPTLEGLVFFNSRAVPKQSRAPKVFISRPIVNGKAAADGATFTGRAALSFDFSAPIFPTAAGASFQTRLIGHDETWVSSTDSATVRYLGLQAGTYSLEVRARKPTSPWSQPVRSGTIEVVPFWYERSWVRLGALVLVGLSVSIVARLRGGVLRGRNEALHTEIEQREQAESLLRASEERFKKLFHTAPSSILSWSPDGRLIDLNRRARSLFPDLRSGMTGGRPADIFEDSALGQAIFERVIASEEEAVVMAATKGPGGRSIRCRWQLAPTFDRHGDLGSVIALVVDLSGHDRAAEKMNKLRSSLAQAEEAERSRIARELHDDLSQRLAALAMHAHIIDLEASKFRSGADPSVQSLHSEIQSIATDVHSLSRQLHPTIVDDLGLVTALSSECGQRGQLAGIPVELDVADNFENPPRDTALALFRITQEAIRNAVKHADASTISVHLKAEGSDAVLRVLDDGDGFSLDAASGGIGLSSMRERARLVGGDLKIASTPGEGAAIIATVPQREA